MENYYIVMSCEKFREMTAEDAELWRANGCTAEDLTASDVMNEYPSFGDYSHETENEYEIKVFETEEEATAFRDENRDESLYSVFSLEELAEKTLEELAEKALE